VVWDGTAPELRAQAPASAYRLSTSDDARALELAEDHPGIRATALQQGGVALSVEERQLDAYVLALGSAGVAVRRLELLASPVESMFFALTSERQADATQVAELEALAAKAAAPA
jgi:ABC-2 type transport system ATP-binding protein